MRVPFRRPWFLFPLIIAGSIILGFFLAFPSIHAWDDALRINHSRWLLSIFGLGPDTGGLGSGALWYGPLWELFLGIMTEYVFVFLHDPDWVRHAFNVALFPITLVLTYLLLLRGGIARSTSLLAVACLFGVIRFGGHALVNVKDFPLAASYLLVTLALWVFLREGWKKDGSLSLKTVFIVSVLSIVPFLVRPPPITHVVILLLFFAAYALIGPTRVSFARRATPFLLVAIIISLLCIVFYPPVREVGLVKGILYALYRFQHYQTWEQIDLLGTQLPSNAIPWWYALAWLPVIAHPFVFLSALGGLLCFFLYRHRQIGHAFVIDTKFGTIKLSLCLWVMGILLLSWVGFLILRPILYNEERHILFLYPLFFLLAALGLDVLREQWKFALAGLIVAASLLSYVHWNRYAYVYESPLAVTFTGQQTSIDYFATCIPLAVEELHGRVEPGARVVLYGPAHLALLTQRSLVEGLIQRVPGFSPYRFLAALPSDRPFAVITYNQDGAHLDEMYAQTQDRKGPSWPHLLWRTDMPNGEIACLLAWYP